MNKSIGLALILAGALAVVSPTASYAAAHKAAAIKTAMAKGGKILVNAKGMTLYIFDKDKAGTSNCNGGCAKKWPPVFSKAKKMMKDGDFSVIKRADGKMQWAYKGHPLYTWFKDKKAGQTTGDGVKGVWHLARP